MELNHRLLVVSQASCPLDDGTELEISSSQATLMAQQQLTDKPIDQGGSRTHKHQALDLAALPNLRTWPLSK